MLLKKSFFFNFLKQNDKPFSAEEEDALTAAFELDADQVSLYVISNASLQAFF